MTLDGTYEATAESPMGTLQAKIALKTEGNSLSGSVTTDMTGEIQFSDGSLDGDSFSVQMTANSPMGEMDMTVIGTVDGDNISGEIQTGMGNMAYTGSKT